MQKDLHRGVSTTRPPASPLRSYALRTRPVASRYGAQILIFFSGAEPRAEFVMYICQSSCRPIDLSVHHNVRSVTDRIPSRSIPFREPVQLSKSILCRIISSAPATHRNRVARYVEISNDPPAITSNHQQPSVPVNGRFLATLTSARRQ